MKYTYILLALSALTLIAVVLGFFRSTYIARQQVKWDRADRARIVVDLRAHETEDTAILTKLLDAIVHLGSNRKEKGPDS